MQLLSTGNDLVEWFRQHDGHLHEALETRHSPEYGYHFIPKTRSLGPTEALCKCPFSLTISHLNILSKPPAGIHNCSHETICSKLIPNARIQKSTVASFSLAEQRLKGEESFWFPYIRVLPTEGQMSTPLWFQEDELVYLKGTNLVSNETPSLGRLPWASRKGFIGGSGSWVLRSSGVRACLRMSLPGGMPN